MAAQSTITFATEVCCALKEGHRLSEIEEQYQVSTEEIIRLVSKQSGMGEETVKQCFDLMEVGFSLEYISEMTHVDVDTLAHFLPTEGAHIPLHPHLPDDAPRQETELKLAQPTQESDDSALRAGEAQVWPRYIYNLKRSYMDFYSMRVSTGQVYQYRLRLPTGNPTSVMTELPGGAIAITGGSTNLSYELLKDAFIFEAWRDFAHIKLPSMFNSREEHGATFYRGYLYCIGGSKTYMKNECERLNLAEKRWEMLKPYPKPCKGMSLVALESPKCLYVLGGESSEGSNFIQRLHLDSLKWDVMTLKLPRSQKNLTSFKLNESEAYIFYAEELFLFKPSLNSITHVRSFNYYVKSFAGNHHFIKDTLYCAFAEGTFKTFKIGSLG
mmetsp:Transcript_25024/g.43925  ORF Transcript_25024/g.43925 Transcript_25024/m.43925 type:complete len:384 (+) Transcript_25024:49-1200(+)